MHYPSLARVTASIAGGLAALALTAAVASAQATSTTPPPAKTAAGTVAPTCTVKFAVDSIPSSPTPLVINALLSAAIGDSISAAFPGASSIGVVSVGPAAAGGANALQLTLNTSAAKAGEWTLALKGKSGDCTGKLKVIAGSQ